MDNGFVLFSDFFILIILGGIFMMMPFVSKKQIIFGVSIPQSASKSQEVKKIRTMYAWIIGISTIVAGIILFIVSRNSNADSKIYIARFVITIFSILIIYYLTYLYCHFSMKKLKQNSQWTTNTVNTIIVDTKFRSRKISVSSMWFLLYLVMIIASILTGISRLDVLPNQLPIHFDNAGIANGFMVKEKAIWIAPSIQLFALGIMFLAYTIIAKSKQDIDINQPEISVKQNTVFRYRMSAVVVFMGILLEALFLIIQLFTIGIIKNTIWLSTIPFVVVVIIIGSVLTIAFTSGQGGWKVRVRESKKKEEITINRNDDKYWKLGSLYYNPSDPSIWVEKRFGIGWTCNFARPISWVFIIIIIGIIIFSVSRV